MLLSRPLPSPELAPNVRARWSEATTKVVLPRCAAGAERGQGRSPNPGGTWRTPDSPAGQRPVHRLFLRLRIGRPARTGAPPPGFLLPSGLEAAADPTVTWNPGTRVPTRIIVAWLPNRPGARCPSAVAAVPFPAGEMARV